MNFHANTELLRRISSNFNPSHSKPAAKKQMTFQLPCKSLEKRIGKELALSKSMEEKSLILTSGLYEYGDSILRNLNTLLQEEGAESPRYKQAQTAASELLTFLALPFIGSCSTYKQGITVLEELGDTCNDPILCRRLVIYMNQIKKRWNQADPAALLINPRAAKIRRVKPKPQPVANGIIWALLGVTALFFFLNLDPISQWTISRQEAPAPESHGTQRENVAPPEGNESGDRPMAGSAPQNPAGAGEYYSRTDAQGVVHLGNKPFNASDALSNGNTQTGTNPGGNLTPVVIKGNRVLVPVTFSYRGRSVTTVLLLDTGASVTTISERLAAQLWVDTGNTDAGTSTVADGRTISSRLFFADAVVVGPRSYSRLRTAILSGCGGEGYEGLLGMDFLKNVRYHVDFNHNVIEWNPR